MKKSSVKKNKITLTKEEALKLSEGIALIETILEQIDDDDCDNVIVDEDGNDLYGLIERINDFYVSDAIGSYREKNDTSTYRDRAWECPPGLSRDEEDAFYGNFQ